MSINYSPNERQPVCILVGFHGEGAYVSDTRVDGLGNIIWQRTRSLILGTEGTSTRIEGQLTHQLRARHEISLKYIEVISHRLQRGLGGLSVGGSSAEYQYPQDPSKDLWN
jgi:hypothetical protein